MASPRWRAPLACPSEAKQQMTPSAGAGPEPLVQTSRASVTERAYISNIVHLSASCVAPCGGGGGGGDDGSGAMACFDTVSASLQLACLTQLPCPSDFGDQSCSPPTSDCENFPCAETSRRIIIFYQKAAARLRQPAANVPSLLLYHRDGRDSFALYPNG